MDEKWTVILYKTLLGAVPVNEFIKSLELKVQSKIYKALDLLEALGVFVGQPHVKKLVGTELWELRILGEDNIRIFYIAITGKTFLVLHGFKKKTNKTPSKEIRIAEDRLAEFRLRE